MSEDKLIAENRAARAKYSIDETFEAGVALLGTEVKAIRAGKAVMRDAFVENRGGELWVKNLHIGDYAPAGKFNHGPLRDRKLLLKRLEINKIVGKIDQKGFTLIPLKMYFKNGWVKVLIGLGKGMKKEDRREVIKSREQKREIAREFKSHRVKT